MGYGMIKEFFWGLHAASFRTYGESTVSSSPDVPVAPNTSCVTSIDVLVDRVSPHPRTLLAGVDGANARDLEHAWLRTYILRIHG